MTTDTSYSKRLNPFTVTVLERGTMNNRSSEFIGRGNLIVNNFFFLSGKHWIKRWTLSPSDWGEYLTIIDTMHFTLLFGSFIAFKFITLRKLYKGKITENATLIVYLRNIEIWNLYGQQAEQGYRATAQVSSAVNNCV